MLRQRGAYYSTYNYKHLRLRSLLSLPTYSKCRYVTELFFKFNQVF